MNLFIDPAFVGRLPVDDLVGLEPETDLALGTLNGVRAVHDVAAGLNTKVAADAARLRVLRVGLAEHLTAGANRIQAAPHHAHNGARRHVLDETREERSSRQVLVVLLQ